MTRRVPFDPTAREPRWLTFDEAVGIAEVKPVTVRQWIARGLIRRQPEGIDLYELMHWLDLNRNMEQARGAALATHNRYQTRRSA